MYIICTYAHTIDGSRWQRNIEPLHGCVVMLTGTTPQYPVLMTNVLSKCHRTPVSRGNLHIFSDADKGDEPLCNLAFTVYCDEVIILQGRGIDTLSWKTRDWTHCNTLQHTATHCNTLQHTATYCTTLQHWYILMGNERLHKLQHTAPHCDTLHHTATYCNMLQHMAPHCNTLQHTATHCNTLQHTVIHCNTLQHTATHCNILHHTAPYCNTDTSS